MNGEKRVRLAREIVAGDSNLREEEGSLFLRGYIDDRVEKGNKSSSGYPPSTLPVLPCGTTGKIGSLMISAIGMRKNREK